MKEFIKKSLHSFGYDFRKFDYRTTYEFMLRELLKRAQVDLVLDVGANYGQYALAIRKAGYTGKIVSFEPLSTAWNVLEKRAAADENWIAARQMAVGDTNGRITIHIAGNSESSSILDMHEIHELAEPSSKYVSEEEVEISRLDDYLPKNNLSGKRMYIKIDTQGFEANVLRGAESTLQHTVGLELELSVKELYQGQMLHEEMTEMLKAKGFSWWSMFPGMVDNRNGRLLQFNGIFVREALVQ